MATIAILAGNGGLEKIDPQLEPNEQEHRLMYVLPALIPRLTDDLPSWVSTWKLEDSPQQQLDALLEIFCSGETITYDRRLKPLNHLGDGVWEMKTPDLRLFGWFPAKDVFILACIDLAGKVKAHNLYAGWAGETVRKRGMLDLNDPKFVAGVEPSDVVSNYDLP